MHSEYKPRNTVAVCVGNVTIGGRAPIVVQSMTNTDTANIAATVQQVRELAQAGSELVRITVNSEEAAGAVPAIVEQLQQAGEDVPLIGDFRNAHRLSQSTELTPAMLDVARNVTSSLLKWSG